MFTGNEAVESFFNSIEVVKGALTPLELQIQRTAKDLECCWLGSNNGEYNLADFGRWTRSDNKFQIYSLKRTNASHVGCEEKRKESSIRSPIKTVMGFFAQNPVSDYHKAQVLKQKDKKKGFGIEDGSCVNCFQFAVTCSLMLSNFIQAIPSPFKIGKRRTQKLSNDDNADANFCRHASKPRITNDLKDKELVDHSVITFLNDAVSNKEENNMSLEGIVGFIFEQFTQNLHKFDQGDQDSHQKSRDTFSLSTPQFDHLKAATSILKGTKIDLNIFLENLGFAKVGGMASSIIGKDPLMKEGVDGDTTSRKEESGGASAQKMASDLLSIPLANVKRLKSSFLSFPLAELIEVLPLVGRPPNDYPDKKKLLYVQEFYRYTEAEGRKFFEELDRDGDGHVTLDDLRIALGRRKLPKRYAREFMRRTKSHLFSKSFKWEQFLSLMEQKESTILEAYTNLCLSKSGTLQKSEILETLKNAGLPANDDNAVAMIRFLNADTEDPISYGHFRNFMLLVPSDRIQDDPRSIWFEAATVVVVEPPVELPAGNVLKSALAGGLACALSTSLMYPIDSIKTRVQASTLSFPEIISKVPEIGVQGLYRGSIPAILGQFSSHGLRTGIFEASKLLLLKIAPTIPEIQVQSLASFCSTFLGTAVRIPCEVMKQRLQAGIFDNVGDAIVGTWRQDGLKGFFRGTCATLCREVPFYVAGMGLYAESKKAVQRVLKRELEPWETIGVGALSGGLAAVVTTPFDVMKTRMMTAQRGRGMSMTMVAFWVVRHHGVMGLFKGAFPRFFWIAPLGAMNFAGYELARKAMDKSNNEDATT